VALRPVVEQHVARAGVETQRAAVGAQQAEVGEAAKVEHGHIGVGHGEHRAVKRRHQRRALAAGGHVAAAEVGDHGNAAALGEQRRRPQLHGIAQIGAVTHRLPMRADRGHVRSAQPAALQQFGHDVGVERGEPLRGNGAAVQFVGAGGVERQQFVAQGRRQGAGGVRHHLRAALRRQVQHHPVHAVERRARHQADEKSTGHSPRRVDGRQGQRREQRAAGHGRRTAAAAFTPSQSTRARRVGSSRPAACASWLRSTAVAAKKAAFSPGGSGLPCGT